MRRQERTEEWRQEKTGGRRKQEIGEDKGNKRGQLKQTGDNSRMIMRGALFVYGDINSRESPDGRRIETQLMNCAVNKVNE